MYHLTPTGTYMFKKTSLNTIGGFDNASMGQEYLLMLKAIESNLKIGYLDDTSVIQYVHTGERISVGANKLAKEKEMIQLKKRYFHKLSNSEKRFVKFRSLAVLTIVGLRSKLYFEAAVSGLKMIVRYPDLTLSEVLKHTSKIRSIKQI